MASTHDALQALKRENSELVKNKNELARQLQVIGYVSYREFGVGHRADQGKQRRDRGSDGGSAGIIGWRTGGAGDETERGEREQDTGGAVGDADLYGESR